MILLLVLDRWNIPDGLQESLRVVPGNPFERRELGIAFVAYSPLGRGSLASRFRSDADFEEGDYRKNHPRFQGQNLLENLKLLARVEATAREKRCSPVQLAFAWVLAQGNDVIPIPGTKRRKHLEENVRALEIALSPDDLKRIDEAAPVGVTAGDRYPEGGMRTINR